MDMSRPARDEDRQDSTASQAGSSRPDVAELLYGLVERAAGTPIPLRVRAWDGSEAGPPEAMLTLSLQSARALRRMLWSPGELGAARAYVAGELDLTAEDGDLIAAFADPRMARAAANARRERGALLPLWLDLLALAADQRQLGPPLPPPPAEARVKGRIHSRRRDAAVISHHYDLGNDFYRLLLGPSMVYSCAYWTRDLSTTYTVDQAQRDKLDLVCGKLGLQPGQRLLDVGCGWGSLVIHAAASYKVQAVGVTVSEQQAAYALEAAGRAGVGDLVEIRVQDYRDIDDGSYDAVASVGMAEHLGGQHYQEYCAQIWELLRPGGRLLHHQITAAHPSEGRRRRNGFIGRYIFPDGDLRPLGEVIRRLEDAGLEVRDVESLREHYMLTLAAWATNLDSHWSAACSLTSPTRVRIWRLYLIGCAAAFATGAVSIHQAVAVRPLPTGDAGLPRRRSEWLPDIVGGDRTVRLPKTRVR